MPGVWVSVESSYLWRKSNMSLPEAGLFGSGLALASLWWNRTVWVLRNWGLAAVEGCLLMAVLPRERAEQRRDSLHLTTVEHLDRASISLQTPSRFHWKTETQVFSMNIKPCVPCSLARFIHKTIQIYCKLCFQGFMRSIPQHLSSCLDYPSRIMPTLEPVSQVLRWKFTHHPAECLIIKWKHNKSKITRL